MSGFERRLRDALRSAGESYRPPDTDAARLRFLRRRARRRIAWTAGGAVVAATAVGVAFLAMPARVIDAPDDPQAAAALRPVPAATVSLGADPSGVARGGGALWVADPDGATVWRIDPATDVPRGIKVAEGPDDLVAVGDDLWVVHPRADVLTRIDMSTGRAAAETPIPASGAHLDVAAAEDALWLLEEGGTLLRFDLAAHDFRSFALDDDPTDVAIVENAPWVYARGAGELRRIDAATGAPTGDAVLVGGAGDADLASAFGVLWFYGDRDGALLRVDPAAATVTREVPLGGTYAGLASGAGSMWAVVGDADGGSVHQINPATGHRIGGASLAVRPVDLDVLAGALWVAAADGTVRRLDLVPADAEPAEVADPSPALPLEDVVLYTSDGSDVFALLRDGGERAIAASAAPETQPAISPDGRTLVLQRGAAGDEEVISVDLVSGAERELGPGSSPAFAPDGRLAWIRATDGGASEIVVADPSGGELRTIAIAGRDAGGLSWSADGSFLSFDADPPARRVYSVSADAHEASPEAAVGHAEASLMSPLRAGAETVVARACCAEREGDPFEVLEIGVLPEDADYRRVKGIDDFGLDPDADRVWLAEAGGLDYEADDGWHVYEERAWFVSDGAALLLVDEDGEADRIDVEGAHGIAVNPLLVR